VVIDAIASPCAVMVTQSQLSVFTVGLAFDVIVVTRFVILLFVSVSVPAIAESVLVVGRVTPVVLVAVNVMAYAPDVIREEPVTSVSVADVVGAVMVTLFIEVAVAAPRVGVTSVGEVENTRFVVAVPVVPVAALR